MSADDLPMTLYHLTPEGHSLISVGEQAARKLEGRRMTLREGRGGGGAEEERCDVDEGRGHGRLCGREPGGERKKNKTVGVSFD